MRENLKKEIMENKNINILNDRNDNNISSFANFSLPLTIQMQANYQNDILNKRTAMQGFAEDEDKLNKTIKLYNSLNSINPGKLVTEDDKDFDKLFD
jgi:hypothetical protein